MKLLRFVILLCAAILGSTAMAQSQDELQQLMRNRGEYYFTLSVDDPNQIQELSRICSVDGTDGRNVVAYANQQEYDKLIALGFQPELQTPPSLRQEAKMWEGGDRATYEWNSYLTYEQYVSMMQGFPASVTNGANCTFLDLGTLSTTNHRKILGVRLNNGQPNGKPKFLYTSTMHGDEVTGMILMLRLIDEFCTSTDSRITNILDNVDLFIFPCTNPDGTYYGGNNSVSNARRANGNSVDLNRHFPDFDDGAHPDATSHYVYQDEAQWMMELAQEYLFTMAANYHGGAEIVNYPWDTYQPLHPDDAWWQYVSREYAQLCQAVSSSYMTTANSNGDTPSGITNGYAWYTITGSRQDYMNYYGQCREVTVECSNTKTPNASQLPNFWNYNHNAMLTYIEECLNGIHGVVKDAITNVPIVGATITVQNHDALGSSVTSHALGDFHRPIKGGTWTLLVSKSGYQSQTVNVTVADGQSQNIVVSLTPRDANEMVCYEHVTPSANGSYLMGSLHGNFLAMPTNNGTKITTNLLDVTVKNYGFSVEETALPSMYSLTANGSQYYIKHNNYYLTRSNNKVTWSTSQSSSNLWYVNDNGIYQTASNTNYYLVYNNGAFSVSTTNRNDIAFYSERSCLPMQFTVTVTANPEEGGTIEGAGTQLEGGTCTLTATAADDYRFIHWTENGEVVSTANPYSFEVIGNRTLEAVFGSTIPVSINVNASPTRGGTVSVDGSLLYGDMCTVTATPNVGYNFINWTENGTVVSENSAYSFMVTEGRDLVANFLFTAAVPMDCYYHATSIAAGSYIMGCLNGTTLYMPGQDNSSVPTISATVETNDDGFSVEEGTTLPQVTLTAYQNSGQYYITYNGRYLARSSSYGNNSLTWATNTSSSARWYINSNGIYLTVSSWGSSTTYYLYYNDGSFQLSTSKQNNITFYTEGDCPLLPQYAITATANPTIGGTIDGADLYYQGETCTLTATANEGYAFVNWTEGGVEVSTDATITFDIDAARDLVANFERIQVISLEAGWNWWVPTLEMDLEDLEAAIGNRAILINSQDEGFARYDGEGWSGTLTQVVPGKMYRIEVTQAVCLTMAGTEPTGVSITLMPGYNWFGFMGSQPTALTALDVTPVEGDTIVAKNGEQAVYGSTGWSGTLNMLYPGHGYIFISEHSEPRSLQFPSGN